MLAFARLASESGQRQQPTGQVRFLILTGIAACRAGWSSISKRSRERVLALNPNHLLGNYESMEVALRDAEFASFLTHLDRFCTFEKAEHLLEELDSSWKPTDDTSFNLESAVLSYLQ